MSSFQSISLGFYLIMFFVSIILIMTAKDFQKAKWPIIAAMCFGFSAIWFSVLYGLFT